MYVWMSVYAYVSAYEIDICMYFYMDIHMYVCMSVCLYVCTYEFDICLYFMNMYLIYGVATVSRID